MANHVTLGGHVVVGDGTVIGGLAAIHQFVRIGQNSMIGGTAGVTEDVIPYGLVVPGKKAFLEGLNLVGLKRGGFSTEEIQALREFYKRVLEPSVPVLQQRMIAFPESLSRHKAVQKLMDFLQVPSTRGLCLPKRAVSVV
jgi:UDP-N-acetylglucosamine acyltransferase